MLTLPGNRNSVLQKQDWQE